MTKAEFINQIQDKSGLTSKKQIEACARAVFDTLIEALASGKDCGWPDFGTFKVVQAKERKGVNPRTGESIEIPARIYAKFIASKNLRKRLNPSC